MALILFAAPVTEASKRGLELGFADPLYGDASPQTRGLWLDRTADASASIVRLGVGWSVIAAEKPSNPRDPADPSYEFGRLDAAVRDAAARGLDVLLTVQGAPAWAEGPNRPTRAALGSWKPSSGAYGDFARAVATRYSGKFAPDAVSPPLPRVRYYQAWNEPNLDTYLTPQWKRGRALGALRYRRLLNAFYAGIKAVDASNLAISAGTAPFGDPRGGQRTRPLTFWRSLLCLRPGRKQRGCAQPAHVDIVAHHPITTRPRRPAKHAGDAVIPELRALKRLVRRAELRRTVKPRARHPLWVTELWWETNPPDPTVRVSLRRQARWIAEALFLIWKQRIGKVLLLQIRDSPLGSNPRETIQTGVYSLDGTPKPSLAAVRFPFVAERRARARLTAWGKAPAEGQLVIERRRKSGWRPSRRLRVEAGEVFRTRLRVRGPARLRARVGNEKSPVWRQRD